MKIKKALIIIFNAFFEFLGIVEGTALILTVFLFIPASCIYVLCLVIADALSK